ncbi:MAG: serine/threonine-protein kinase [Verrucomicrobia bacterium]|nr:serine/threonine-protein kinase [Verrucomicrobiota bacterium]
MESDIEASVIGGRYVIDRKLGSGGEGAVYLAYDQLLNRHVAIKSVHTGAEALTDASGAFNEAKRLASLQHPNIVTIFDFLPSHENVFVVMEFINGESLDNLSQPMEVRVFLEFARQCLDALGAAHSLGMVHRDIKSANIMVTWTEGGDARVKLLDFGLAKVMTAPSEQTLDHSGALTGSIYFLSPEQLNCQPIDHRADFYSLGCVFYRALTLRNPFQGVGIPSIIAAHLQHDFIPLAEYRPDLPTALAAWVEKFFSFSPDDRPAHAASALVDLERLKNPRPAANKPAARPAPPKQAVPAKPVRRFPMWIAAVVTTLAIAGIFAAASLSQSKTPPPPAEEGEERDMFTAGERVAIGRRDGKTATVTGEIGQFREEGSRRFLTFKGADSEDVALCFVDSEKGNFSRILLKTFVGEKVTATGVVSKDGKRLLLEVPNMSQLSRQVLAEPQNKPKAP